jgi:hypothetical protein
MRIIFFTFFLFSALIAQNQETLLLGEQQVHEIYFESREDGIEKVSIYISKYRENGNYEDSTFTGFENYNRKGELVAKTNYSGKGQKLVHSQYSYEYTEGNMTAFQFIQTSPSSNFGRQGDFKYTIDGLLIHQGHSLANIKYSYYADGRMKTKSYFYNNKGSEETEPWIHYYMYDDSLNLIHVDTDKESTEQSSFFDERNELIRHDYYPGVAYSKYEYDQKGNCIKQLDFELGKKDWDSTVFIYSYRNDNQIASSGSLNKKGKLFLDTEFEYDAKGRLKAVLYLRRNKRKLIKKYFYTPFIE